MSFFARFTQLSWRDRLLLSEAMLCLIVASLLISLLSFSSIARLVTSGRRIANPAPAPSALKIAWALNACANKVPWKAVCFQRAVAAQMMLRRRGWATVINYGIRRDDEGALAAHVWARSGDVDVIGCENAVDFQLITSLQAGGAVSEPPPLKHETGKLQQGHDRPQRRPNP